MRLYLCLLCAAACSKAEPKAAPDKQGGPPPALVKLAKAEDGKLTDGWRFLGRVEPALESEIAAAVEAHVKKVHVREGDNVKKGAVLLTLDGAKVSATVAAATAREKSLQTQLDLAKKQWVRVKDLGYPTVSEPERERLQADVDNLAAQLETQQAEIRSSQVDLGRHRIKAPFAGVITSRKVDPGAWVGIGEPVLSLVSLEDAEIHVDVSVELGSRLEVGKKAKLLSRDRSLDATVSGVVPALDDNTRTMRVRLRPDESQPWLLPGLTLDVEFALTYEGGGVIVSRDAILRGPVSSRVIKVVDGKAVPVTVKIVATAKDSALVSGEGLKAGDDIVIRGTERLRPDQPVKPVD
jgi:RND family efflux transporter MFP subunit